MASQSTVVSARLGREDWLWLILCGALSSAWCIASASRLGATFDEPFYLAAGLDYWRHGTFRELLAAGVMPLATHLQTMPLYLTEGSGREWSLVDDIGAMLPVARSVTLVFWWVLLFYAYRLAKLCAGSDAARLALVLIAFNPSFLAHASLATTDIALAATILAFTWLFIVGREQRWRWRVALPAVALALAISAKASAIAIGPLIMAAIVLHHIWRSGARSGKLRSGIRDALTILVCATVMAVVYCGPGGGPSFQGTLARMPADHALRPIVELIASLPLFPNGIYALWYQVDHGATGQPVFIAGIADTAGVWFYLPVLLTIKLPLMLLLLTAGGLAVKPHRAQQVLLGLAALGTAMLLIRVQTGVRFVLPFLALLVIWIAARLTPALEASRPIVRRKLISAGVIWAALTAIQAWPDGLRYTNELWGETERGYRYVSDSNYDWGQGLPELAEWQARSGDHVSVWYFGTDPRFPQLRRVEPRQSAFSIDSLGQDKLAVSTSLLYGGYVRGGAGLQLILRLRGSTPIGRTSTFLIYDPLLLTPTAK